ncbi:MAG: ABC transporter permease, partial [Clostridia bacterium]|nr:ABC transporter permease [Clostridia bacterium]
MKKLRFNRSQLCIPYAVFLILFVIAPLIVILYYAFTNGQGNFTFSNFAAFFTSTNTLGTLLYSFAVAIVTTI